MNIAAVDDAASALVDALTAYGPYAIGWLAGWFLLWRLRPLPAAPADRRPIAIVVPARNEADSLPHLLPPLVGSMRPGDELVVVDDHSTDGTGEVARALGATVVTPPEPPAGWLGKPNACWHGAGSTSAPLLAFLDADVRPDTTLLDRLAGALDAHPGEVVSVQPWHVTGRPSEQLSLFCNVTALMGVGRFSVLGERVRPRAAFGPVLAIDRDTYDRTGGHSRPDVRTMHTEDIGIARAVGRTQLYTGRPDVTFRMYPGGLSDLVRGWTRSIATGATAVPWWATLLTLAWVWSLAAGWTVSPWLLVPSAAQVWVLGRRAGRFSPVVAVLYPAALVVFVVVFLRSLVTLTFGRDVVWKDRHVASR